MLYRPTTGSATARSTLQQEQYYRMQQEVEYRFFGKILCVVTFGLVGCAVEDTTEVVDEGGDEVVDEETVDEEKEMTAEEKLEHLRTDCLVKLKEGITGAKAHPDFASAELDALLAEATKLTVEADYPKLVVRAIECVIGGHL